MSNENTKRNIIERFYCCEIAKLRIFSEVSKEYLQIVYAEDATVEDFATFAGGKYFNISPTSVKIVSQGDTSSEFEYAPIRLPHGNIDRVARVQHCASGAYMNGVHGL